MPRLSLACPICSKALSKAFSCQCGWKRSQGNQEYLANNWVRFPIAIITSLSLWTINLWLGGWFILMAISWSLFFGILLILTLKTSSHLKYKLPEKLSDSDFKYLQENLAEANYGFSLEELLEQYKSRYELLEKAATKSQRRQRRQLLGIAQARLETCREEPWIVHN